MDKRNERFFFPRTAMSATCHLVILALAASQAAEYTVLHLLHSLDSCNSEMFKACQNFSSCQSIDISLCSLWHQARRSSSDGHGLELFAVSNIDQQHILCEQGFHDVLVTTATVIHTNHSPSNVPDHQNILQLVPRSVDMERHISGHEAVPNRLRGLIREQHLYVTICINGILRDVKQRRVYVLLRHRCPFMDEDRRLTSKRFLVEREDVAAFMRISLSAYKRRRSKNESYFP